MLCRAKHKFPMLELKFDIHGVPTYACPASIGWNTMASRDILNINTRQSQGFPQFTKTFLDFLSQPTELRPTVRCLSLTDAKILVAAARDANPSPDFQRVSASDLIELLEKSGILQPLKLVDTPRSAFGVYAVGPQGVDKLDPIELLEAAVPVGVVCYFTALQYYGFTTQSAIHHHIAQIIHRETQPAKPRPSRSSAVSTTKASRNILGTQLFKFGGTPFYKTVRSAHTIAGIQFRQLNDRTIARITTREQTLLDTLHRPLSCGGASVVWEAWQHGMQDIDEARLLAHLQQIGDRKLWRRVSYMLQAAQHTPGKELSKWRDNFRNEIKNSPEIPTIPLMPGLPSLSVDSVWRLELPNS